MGHYHLGSHGHSAYPFMHTHALGAFRPGGTVQTNNHRYHLDTTEPSYDNQGYVRVQDSYFSRQDSFTLNFFAIAARAQFNGSYDNRNILAHMSSLLPTKHSQTQRHVQVDWINNGHPNHKHSMNPPGWHGTNLATTAPTDPYDILNKSGPVHKNMGYVIHTLENHRNRYSSRLNALINKNQIRSYEITKEKINKEAQTEEAKINTDGLDTKKKKHIDDLGLAKTAKTKNKELYEFLLKRFEYEFIVKHNGNINPGDLSFSSLEKYEEYFEAKAKKYGIEKGLTYYDQANNKKIISNLNDITQKALAAKEKAFSEFNTAKKALEAEKKTS